MTIAIMQPTYLPWIGYFDLIKSADNFIFLDDVKFEYNSWHRRNKIISNIGKEQFISIPISSSRKFNIEKTVVNDEINWRNEHMKKITDSYKKSEYFNEVKNIFFSIIKDTSKNLLSDINVSIIKKISRALEFNTTFHLSSEIKVQGKKSKKLLNILNYFNEEKYISPIGSKEYIEKEGLLEKEKIKIKYYNFKEKPYAQINNKNQFISYLSIIDLMMNIGVNNSIKYFK
jgi:hypothetical protein